MSDLFKIKDNAAVASKIIVKNVFFPCLKSLTEGELEILESVDDPECEILEVEGISKTVCGNIDADWLQRHLENF